MDTKERLAMDAYMDAIDRASEIRFAAIMAGTDKATADAAFEAAKAAAREIAEKARS